MTTDDGREVYFTTDLVQRSALPETRAESRVFRLDGRSVHLFAERGAFANPAGSVSSDGASSLHVSADGQTIAFVLANVCASGASCQTGVMRAEIRGRDAAVLGEASTVLLSRNGKWALLVPPPFFRASRFDPPVENTESVLVNLTTGARTVVGMPLTASGLFALASDGSILQRVRSTAGIRIGVWKDGELKPLPPLTGGVAFLGMSDDAGIAIVERLELPPPGQAAGLPSPDLLALDLRSGEAKVVHSGASPVRHLLLGIANNGRRALFRTHTPSGPGHAVLFDVQSGASVVLKYGDGELPVAGALSGDGNVAILGMSSGRLLRFSFDSALTVAATEELLPPTPYLRVNVAVAPGGLLEVEPPLPGDIDWTGRIQVDGMPLAVVRANAGSLLLQVPWEAPTTVLPVAIDHQSDSPFVQRTRLFVAPIAPRFLDRAPDAEGVLGGMLIRADFSGYVAGPLKAGDVFHMYMTGLGAVRGAIKTGEPAPLDQLRPLAGYAHCMFTPHASDAETLFAGLAPGTVGVYQLTFRMPPDTPANFVPTGMRCGFNTPGYSLVMGQLGP